MEKSNIDLCIVATLRPEILKRTIVSFFKHITYVGGINLCINIDCVPKYKDHGKREQCINDIGVICGMAAQIFKKNCKSFIVTDGFNFSAAVKRLWVNTKSDYVFHLEDDWEFIKDIDLNECIERMNNEDFDYMRFPKKNAPHLNRLWKVALQPSLWRGNVVRELAEHMKTDKDPEKQLRIGQGNKKLDKILTRIQKKGLKDYCSEWCCQDIGREWREEQGLIKWNAVEPEKVSKNNQNAKNITWWEK